MPNRNRKDFSETNTSSNQTDQNISSIFNEFDHDKDGKLNADEVEELLHRSGAKLTKVTNQQQHFSADNQTQLYFVCLISYV